MRADVIFSRVVKADPQPYHASAHQRDFQSEHHLGLVSCDGGTMRPAVRHKLRHLYLSRAQIRSYAAATDGPAIRAVSHPAPHTGHIRVLLLDQPHNRNALSRRLCNDLRRHVDEIKAEGQDGSTRALVIASNVDKVFCAGADLKERKGMSGAECVSSQTISRQPAYQVLERLSSLMVFARPLLISRTFISQPSLP